MASRPPAFVRALPRRAVSRLMGQIGALQPPAFVLQPILRLYAHHFGVALDEMAHPLASYKSFLSFFTRPLRPGARPTDPDPRAIVSPADGTVQWAGRIEDGQLLQVKGIRYRVAELLADEAEAAAFEGGSALVAYLSPGDYHRFHWPYDGTVDRIQHLAGALWPVNEGAVNGVPGLFAINERVAVTGSVAGGGRHAFVPVGALNVGSIRLAGVDLVTNRHRRTRREVPIPERLAARRGAECGWFAFGSSIVLLLSRDAGTLEPLAPGSVLRVGRPIGRLA